MLSDIEFPLHENFFVLLHDTCWIKIMCNNGEKEPKYSVDRVKAFVILNERIMV